MILSITAANSSARAQSWFSIGPKLGYTFGKEGGFTGGLEVSYFPSNRALSDQTPPTLFGFTCDLTILPHGRMLIHFGAEGLVAAGLAGLDIGPTMVFAEGRLYSAFTFIPFVGVLVYPFYEYTVPFSHLEPISTMGVYIKYPISIVYRTTQIFGW